MKNPVCAVIKTNKFHKKLVYNEIDPGIYGLLFLQVIMTCLWQYSWARKSTRPPPSKMPATPNGLRSVTCEFTDIMLSSLFLSPSFSFPPSCLFYSNKMVCSFAAHEYMPWLLSIPPLALSPFLSLPPTPSLCFPLSLSLPLPTSLSFPPCLSFHLPKKIKTIIALRYWLHICVFN